MKRYRVVVTKTEQITIDVEADSLARAEGKANQISAIYPPDGWRVYKIEPEGWEL